MKSSTGLPAIVAVATLAFSSAAIAGECPVSGSSARAPQGERPITIKDALETARAELNISVVELPNSDLIESCPDVDPDTLHVYQLASAQAGAPLGTLRILAASDELGLPLLHELRSFLAQKRLGLVAPLEQRSVSESDVIQAVRKQMPLFRACYERALKRSPGLRGKVILALTIESSGRVRTATIEQDSINEESVTECLMVQAKRLKIGGASDPSGAPAASGDRIEVSVPFHFTSGN